MPVLAVIVTYLAASVSFPYWVARAYGVDLRAVGERKLGGGNLAKTSSPRASWSRTRRAKGSRRVVTPPPPPLEASSRAHRALWQIGRSSITSTPAGQSTGLGVAPPADPVGR